MGGRERGGGSGLLFGYDGALFIQRGHLNSNFLGRIYSVVFMPPEGLSTEACTQGVLSNLDDHPFGCNLSRSLSRASVR